MKNLTRLIGTGAVAAALFALTACTDSEGRDDAPTSQHNADDGHGHGDETAAAPTNRVAIPASVRANLGITFVKAERRRIEQTLRVPGQFEFLPTARREYRTMMPGRVELLVQQFDHVDAGTSLYRIDSPAWRELQQTIAETVSSIGRQQSKLSTFEPLLAAHQEHQKSLQDSIDVWSARVAQLEAIREAGGGRMSEQTSAQAALATARADMASVREKQAELAAARIQAKSDLQAARARKELLLDSAASILDVKPETLLEQVGEGDDAKPRWRAINAIVVRATTPGVVESLGLTNGAWADQQAAVLTIVRPDRLRFHASGLQSDLGVLRDGLPARIVPPTPTAAGRAVPLQDTMSGTLSLGLTGDAADRTIDLYVTPEELAAWARPGVTAQLEIVTDATQTPTLAIPLAAVQRDGLIPVIFRRAPDDANEAIRMEADLGADDGRWIAVLSGLRDGDEVVLDGAFQLMLATSGSIQQGGHFHPDGTFHEGED